jgi:hypothetical protein
MAKEPPPANPTGALLVRCDCGFEVRAPLAELVPLVQQHGREAHNMEVTPAEVAAMARPD